MVCGSYASWSHKRSSHLATCVLVAALISAVDPVATLATFASLKVEPVLNMNIAGESLFNDAVSIVLFKTFQAFVHLPDSDEEDEKPTETKTRGKNKMMPKICLTN